MKESNASKMGKAAALGAMSRVRKVKQAQQEVAALKQQVKDLEAMVKRGGKL